MTDAISLAFGTTTSNTWAGTQVFTNAPTLAAFTGLVGASGGVSYAISTSSLDANITGNAATVTTNANLNGVVTSSGNTTSWGSATAGVLGTSATGIPTFMATSTLYGAGGIPNAALANSTISGIALGADLAALTNDATLNGSSYNGSGAISDWGLNLGNANTWTALQTFGNASTTQIGSTGSAYFATAGGNVGIGTTTPYSRLSVWGADTGATSMFELTNSASTTLASVLNDGTFYMNGNVGIGTTSPTTNLSVAGSAVVTGTVGIGTASVQAVLDVQDSISSTIAATFRGVAGTNRIGLGTIAGITDGTPFAQGFSSSFAAVDMTLQPNGGNVGIGTTSPGTLLSIGGTGTGINFVDGTTATSTISGNLWVKGTLRTGTGSLYMNDTGITSSDGNLSLQRNGVSYLNGGNLALGANSLTMTGSLGATGARLTKGWFTDLQVSNTIAGAINGNAGSAAILQTGRTINGTNFNGSENITVTAAAGTLTGATLASGVTASSLTSVGTITSGTWSGSFGAVSGANLTSLTAANISAGTAGISVTGNAGSATILQTARNINGVSFNGTADITVTAAAGTLTGTSLATGVTAATGLTSVGTLNNLVLSGTLNVGSIGAAAGDLSICGTGATGKITAFSGACGTSDARLKTNIVDFSASDGLAVISALRPVHFDWKDATLQQSRGPQIGFLAQDVQEFFPQIVTRAGTTTILFADGTTEDVPDTLALDYQKLTVPLIKAVQELDARTRWMQNAATSTSSGQATPVLTVDVAGRVGIGTTTPAHTLDVAGDIGAIAFINTSTRSLKTDINYMDASSTEEMLDRLKNLKVASYRYKIEEQNEPLRLGLIAEDTATIAPELLSADGKGVDLYKLATFTLSGVQALAIRVEGHETRLASLETRIFALESGAVAVATTSTLAPLESISLTGLASAIEGIDSVLRIGKLISDTFYAAYSFFDHLTAANVTVGSATTPSGVTLYDSVTKQPYCFSIANGAPTTTPGICSESTESLNPFATSTAPTTSITITDSTDSTTLPQQDSGQVTTDSSLQAATTTTDTTASSTPISIDTTATDSTTSTSSGQASSPQTTTDTATATTTDTTSTTTDTTSSLTDTTTTDTTSSDTTITITDTSSEPTTEDATPLDSSTTGEASASTDTTSTSISEPAPTDTTTTTEEAPAT
ncbi:hypothetical protein A3G12_01765 [Candidatus Kaiserbacteria bacterium RIFCSPLOWO2_12_FULL_54_10]|nr:MAG: hypothetical protein A3G12_01765 [Candidatus Kaiserbacteria bacterium RIFCSPLOWO2_12_FULL_54_10]